MKKASKYLKQLFSAIVAAVRATKASSLRTRLIVLSIMRNKKLLLSTIQSKIHAIMGGGGHAGHGNAVAGHDEGADGGAGGRGLFLASAGRNKAAVLQSLPSFVVEQEKRAVVLLSSMPSFALERDAGAGEGGDDDAAGEATIGGEKLLASADAAAPGAAIEVVRGAAAAAEGEFRLEEEIDRVADVFIRRFHDQMKLQKLESFKRFCEMLERGA